MKEDKELKITAIIKTQNCEDTLCDTLESINDIDEIIVVDLHSNDDTVQIAKEYKAKIIFADKNDVLSGLNQALDEANNDWILVVEENEIFPQKLIREIQNYIENPKKNKESVYLSQKNFYYKKEIKQKRNKNILRLFKKGNCKFSDNYSSDLELINGKAHKINKNFRIHNCYILKFQKEDVVYNFNELLQKNRFIAKNSTKENCSVVIKPLFVFIYWYFFKGCFLSGRLGFIFAIEKYLDEYLKQLMLYERSMK